MRRGVFARQGLNRVRLLAALLIVTAIGMAAQGHASPVISGCPVFPTASIWNTPVDAMPIDPQSSAYVNTIGAGKGVHPDFGSGTWDGGPIGIPFNVVPGSQPRVPITFDYDDESDPGPYPIPPEPAIEGGSGSTGDRHVLVVDRDDCVLYETWSTYPQPDGSWHAGSGAIFDLRSNALRPRGWTSSDAAGLPVLPGLVRYEEVAAGEISHALRFTAAQTRRAYIWPARHYASSLTGTQYPPMGQRFRLRASFDVSGFSPEVRVILTALKRYGMILADNGSSWYISGVPDPRWNNDVLVNELRRVTGADFEAVDESSLMVDPDSAQARLTGACPDNDGDGYGHPASTGCMHPETDCDDANPEANPGWYEVPGNGMDDDCNPATPDEGAWTAADAQASVAATGTASTPGSRGIPLLGAFLLPLGVVAGMKVLGSGRLLQRPGLLHDDRKNENPGPEAETHADGTQQRPV